SITATSTSTTDGQKIASHDQHLTLSGVTAGGQPAKLDETGIHIGGSSTSAGPLNQALATALGQAGVTIKVLGTDSSITSSSGTSGNTLPGKTVTSQVQGVLFHVEQFLPIPNATDTYFTTVTLGAASTVAGASIERGAAAPAEAGGIGGLETPAVPAVPGTPPSLD